MYIITCLALYMTSLRIIYYFSVAHMHNCCNAFHKVSLLMQCQHDVKSHNRNVDIASKVNIQKL